MEMVSVLGQGKFFVQKQDFAEHTGQMPSLENENHERFLRYFMEHEDSLRIFLRTLLFSRDEVREVMQEVAAVLWRKFDETMDSQAFRRWAFGVARMEALAFRRDRARDRLVFSEDVMELLAQAVEDHAESLDEERSALETCLKRLPEKHRNLIQAAYAPGVRIQELAARLGKTSMAVYRALHRIRLTLMECTRRMLVPDTHP